MKSSVGKSTIKIAFLLLVTAITSFSQERPGQPITQTAPGTKASGTGTLPEGYRNEPRRGIDSKIGAIIRGDGFTITYDIGRMAGNYAAPYFPEHFESLRKQTHLNRDAIEQQVKYLQDRMQWRQRQQFKGDELMLVMLKDNTLIASFANSYANFMAKADSSDKIADFLLIVTSYPFDPKSANK